AGLAYAARHARRPHRGRGRARYRRLTSEHRMSDEPVIVGHIRRTHGVRGEVMVEPASDVAERFLELETVLVVGRDGGQQEWKVEGVRRLGAGFAVTFAGVFDPETARRRLVGRRLAVPRAVVPAAGRGGGYHFGVMGCDVVGT